MSVRRLAVATVAVTALVAAATALLATRDESSPARRLLDGSAARPPPVEPASLPAGAVLTRVRVAPAGTVPGYEACQSTYSASGLDERTPVVERVGLDGRSVTFRARGTPFLHACEVSARQFEPRGPWCGGATGRLVAGRLRDGRLNMVNCLDAAGRTVAFAWIDPLPRARWIAVEDEGRVEVYAAAGGLPVRVTTKGGVDAERSRATFHVTQYAAGGSELDERDVEMAVAG